MNKSIEEILETMNEEQISVVNALLESVGEEDEEQGNITEVQHSIFNDAKRDGSLKDSYLEHAATYGIDGIETLFPDATNLNKKPMFIKNKTEWVNKVLGAVHKQPFARVKTMFADITEETARAKGYVTATLKVEDAFTLLKRTTEPTTIYKKQKIDRDDVIDITDFDVVAWIKEEMKMKLEEELARAILIGDGRLVTDNYKIDEECIRPVYNDEDLFTIKMPLGAEENKYKAFINACVRGRKQYRGSGTPTLYTTEDLLAEILLLEDNIGHRLYKSVEEIKATLRVVDIVTINEMADLVRDGKEVLGIIVNLNDYSVGANRGGQVSMFDDFDIDYNQQKYLIETRCSGALTTPYSAMVIEGPVTTPPAGFSYDEL